MYESYDNHSANLTIRYFIQSLKSVQSDMILIKFTKNSSLINQFNHNTQTEISCI